MTETYELVNVVLDYNVYGTNVIAWLRHIITRDDGTEAVNELTSMTFLEEALYKRAREIEWSDKDLQLELAARCKVAEVPIVEPEPPEVVKDAELT